MKVRSFTIDDARFELSPGQDGGVFTANLVDELMARQLRSAMGAMIRTKA